MKIKLTREVKIGLFFVLMLVVIFAVLNFLKGQDIFKKSYHYYAVYEDVEGLTATSHVFLKGLKIGSIEKISFNPESDKFVVKIAIKNNYHIPVRSFAQIFSTDIMGNKALRIVFSEESQMMSPGDTLLADAAPELGKLLSKELLPLKNKVDTLISALNITVGSLNNVLNTESQQDLVAGIASLRHTLANVQQLSLALNQERETIKNIVENTDGFMTELKKSSKDISRTMSNLSQITDSLKSSELTATIANLNAILKQANDPSGSVGKLLHNDSLYNNATRAIGHLDSLIVAIQANPKKYIKISVF